MDRDSRRSIGEDIKTLQLGWPVGMPLARKMGDDLWELRSMLSWGIARTFFTVHRVSLVLLHGFVKKSRKTPAKELAIAKASNGQIEVVEMSKRNLGSPFDDFLKEEGLLEEVTAVAIKRFIAYQLEVKMSEDNLTKTEMARRMGTSRSALDRLLDPENPSVTLQTLQSAAQALGGRLKIELDFHRRAA